MLFLYGTFGRVMADKHLIVSYAFSWLVFERDLAHTNIVQSLLVVFAIN